MFWRRQKAIDPKMTIFSGQVDKRQYLHSTVLRYIFFVQTCLSNPKQTEEVL